MDNAVFADVIIRCGNQALPRTSVQMMQEFLRGRTNVEKLHVVNSEVQFTLRGNKTIDYSLLDQIYDRLKNPQCSNLVIMATEYAKTGKIYKRSFDQDLENLTHD